MIGNDVIDIVQSRRESNWQRKGFLEKIFTAEEQLLIANDVHPETMVWLLWSMKEAAYKIYNRQTKIRAYIPQKLVCSMAFQNNSYASGKVSCCGTVYYTQTFIHREYLHTIAVSDPAQWDTVIEIEKKNIAKDPYGIPFLSSDPSPNRQNVSVSNHGRFEKVVGLSA
ncbi:4-phosphopantetheinyl transferase family protein [Flavobacterium cupreum]|uniref:4-phosphopantetheinyl transferase family protein n=1 Tax=Flavobacterium cupreum TaxID=2133766 RepID=A0A434ACV1_9FLAO|nr:4'-phosphopantetheinyl transferase superfamily protein [Flavobacterium cupreum]RUT72184.1 4-phosphopantetheinyl transferase family protein [Flavobacterium cupreum]